MDDLPSIKLSHSYAADILAIISKHEGNRKAMDNAIYAYFVKHSKRPTPPSFKNATRAVTYPSLHHLELIMGDRGSIRLSPIGALLVEAKAEGQDEYVRVLAKHLVRWQCSEHLRGLCILQKIKEMPGKDFVTTLDRLASRYWPSSSPSLMVGNLRRLLGYFELARLVALSNGQVILNEGQIAAARRVEQPPPTLHEFSEMVLKAYTKLAMSLQQRAVPIPLLERDVCRAFNGRLWHGAQFRDMLTKMPRETPDYVLLFMQPMMRESGGIRIGERYYYYLQIDKRM